MAVSICYVKLSYVQNVYRWLTHMPAVAWTRHFVDFFLR